MATRKTEAQEKVRVRVKTGKHFVDQFVIRDGVPQFTGETKIFKPGDELEVTPQVYATFAFKFELVD